MTHITRVKCDGCNREIAVVHEGRRWLPSGWFEIDGPYDRNGESYNAVHACSVDCIAAIAHRLRIDDDLLPAVLK